MECSANANLTVTMAVDKVVPNVVCTDERRFGQIFTNGLANAIRVRTRTGCEHNCDGARCLAAAAGWWPLAVQSRMPLNDTAPRYPLPLSLWGARRAARYVSLVQHCSVFLAGGMWSCGCGAGLGRGVFIVECSFLFLALPCVELAWMGLVRHFVCSTQNSTRRMESLHSRPLCLLAGLLGRCVFYVRRVALVAWTFESASAVLLARRCVGRSCAGATATSYDPSTRCYASKSWTMATGSVM